MARTFVKDASTATVLGLALVAGGAFLLYDAHERRGIARPFWLRLFGGWV